LLLTGGSAKCLLGYSEAANVRYVPDLLMDGFKYI